MNVATVCIAVALVCAFGPTAARAESTSVSIAASAAAVSSTASVSIAGLSAASIRELPGFPVKAYRDGYRDGRVKLSYVVNGDGTVGNVQVLEAFPVQVFTRTATNAVASWRFAPTGGSEKRTVEFQFSAE
jgi:protein TonB